MKKSFSFFEQIRLGIRTYGKAISFVFEKGLWIYFVYSIIIAGFLTFTGFELIRVFTDWLEALIMGYFTPDWEGGWLSFLGTAMHYLLSIGLRILFFFVFSSTSKYILLILMSPLMALLSERAEELITGKVYPFQWAQFAKDILRGVLIAFRNMAIEFGFIFLGFFVVWIPLVGWCYPLFLIVLAYYFYGFSMIDYVSERRRKRIKESVRFVRKNKGLVIGNGFIFALLFAIPFIGPMIAAVLAPVAACAAVLEAEK